MRKGCEDGNRWSGSYFTWGGHGTPHVKRLGCLAGWPDRAGWPAGRPESVPTVVNFGIGFLSPPEPSKEEGTHY